MSRLLMHRLAMLVFVVCALNTAAVRAADPEAVAMNMVDAWNDVDLDRVVALFTPDGVLHSMMTDPIVGRDSLRSHLQPLFDGIDELNLNLRRVVVDGDTVAVRGSFEGVQGEDRVTFDFADFHVFDEDGLIAHRYTFTDRDTV